MHTGDEWGTGAGARPRSRAEIDAIAREMLRAERAGERSEPRVAVDELARRRAAVTQRRRPGWLGWAVLAVVAVLVVVKVLTVAASSLGLGGSGLGGVPDHPTEYADGSYEFMNLQPRDPTQPVGYNPCLVIPVDVNFSGAPPHFLELAQEVIGQIDQASGLRLQYAGQSGAKRRSQAPNGRVLIAFDDVADDDSMQDVAGRGGSSYYLDAPTAGTKYYIGGAITLNTDAFNHYSHRAQSLVLAHELGHVLGLAHVDGDDEVMNPGNYSVHEWGHGDLTALAKLGKLPCR